MKKLILHFTVVIIVSCSAFSQELEWSGYGAAGYRNTNRERIIEYNQEMYFEAKVQADLGINKNIGAQVDIRGNSADRQMELREVSVKFMYIRHMDIKFGNLKKSFTSEQIESSEDLAQIERSYLNREITIMGYGGRSVGGMVQYKSSGKKDDLPYSYHIFLFKNNNLQQGLTGRYEYHIDDDNSAAASYFLLHTGGDYPVLTNAASAGYYIRKKKFDIEAELVIAQNPIEGIRRKAIDEESSVVAWGSRLLANITFDTGAEIIKEIEPLLMVSYFQPELEETGVHTFQLLAGSNFYFHKDVRARLNADVLLSKNLFYDKYSTYDSRLTLELQVRF